MYIYLDIFIVINFILNGIILYLTAYLNNIPCNFYRLIIANIFSVLYLIIGLVFNNQLFFHPLIKFIISLGLIFILFGKKKVRNFLMLVGTFYFISFLLGGAIFGYLFMLDYQPIGWLASKNQFYLSFTQLVCGVSIGIIIILFIFRSIAVARKEKNNFQRITVVYQNKSISVMTLIDTGNRLYTMQGHYPVILIEKKVLLPLFPKSVIDFLNNNSSLEWISRLEQNLDDVWCKRLFFVPYKSLGGKHILLAFHPDAIMIGDKLTAISKVAIGIHEEAFSEFGQYQGLLHPDIK